MRRKTILTPEQSAEKADALRLKKHTKEIRWDKLDNTAHLFPVIAGERMSNVYRISVTLKELVDPELLQQALDIVLPKFDGFNLRLRHGVFWLYFEENGKPAPRVKEETKFPCRYIRPNRNNSYLFRVTYYQYRINLEVFHVLTDGMGGFNFIRELTYQYLRLRHPEILELTGDAFSSETTLNREDSFVKNFKKTAPKKYKTQKAYLIKGEHLRIGEFGVMHGYIPVADLKAVCKKYGVSINEYLVTCYIWSIYTEYLHGMPSKRPIRVAVPVNLRHILVGFEGGTYDETTGATTYSDEEKAAAKAKAQEILDAFNAGEKTEEAFGALATEKTTDPGSKENGGLYENVYPGQMVASFNDWCFDAARKTGDTAIVETEYGCHVMYFVGTSETTYRDYMIESALRSEDMAAWENGLIEAAELVVTNTKYVKTDLTLNSGK